jgi:hypothetical protein
MKMTLEHVQPRGNRRVYRRKVPKALQGIPEKLKRSIMGHSGGGAGDNYGGEEARLKVATEAMEKALGPETSN